MNREVRLFRDLFFAAPGAKEGRLIVNMFVIIN
jgi:hypothetical protein